MSCSTDGPAVTQKGQVQPSRKRTTTLPAYVLSETAGPVDQGGPPARVLFVKAGAASPSCTHARAGPQEASHPRATTIAIVLRIRILRVDWPARSRGAGDSILVPPPGAQQ